MRVRDVMTRDPLCCRPDDDLATVANIMWNGDCGAVPVKAEGDRVVGMLTDRDLCMAALMNGKPLHELRAADVMSRGVVSCSPGDHLYDAQLLMRSARVRRLPVEGSEGRIVGILSLRDVARAASASRRSLFPSVRLKDVALTLVEVSRPAPKEAPPPPRDDVAYAE